MQSSEYLQALRREVAAFGAAARAGGLDAPVGSCPGWLMADLVWHLTEAHYFWASIVEQRATHVRDVVPFERAAPDDLLAVYDAQSERLIDVLSRTDPTTVVWTWSADHDVAFVLRRIAHETAMHRWDAESAAGHTAPIDAALASDGIDEFLTHFVDDIAEGAELVGGSVHIHCTDVDGEWTIRPRTAGDPGAADGFEVTREHAKGDCALRGPATDLLLALWRRTSSTAIDVIGAADVAARFLASTNLD
jgi:uncharacterized protein (TIGR03083 family)